jgi:hypothetical protein
MKASALTSMLVSVFPIALVERVVALSLVVSFAQLPLLQQARARSRPLEG